MVSVLYMVIISLFLFVEKVNCEAAEERGPVPVQQFRGVGKVVSTEGSLHPSRPHPRIGRDLLPFAFDDSDEIVLKLTPVGTLPDGELMAGASPLSRQFWALVKTQELLYAPRKEWSLMLKMDSVNYVIGSINYHFR